MQSYKTLINNEYDRLNKKKKYYSCSDLSEIDIPLQKGESNQRRRYYRAQKQAIKRNKKFYLSFDQYTALVSLPCNYCGEKIGEGIGLDRKNNSIGYIIDNVLPCCGSCNLIRGNRLTVEEMEIAMKAVIEYRTNKKTL